MKLENKTVYLSVPDSIGRQYPTSVSQTTVNKEEKEHKTTDMRTEATLKHLITEIDELRQQFNAATLKKERWRKFLGGNCIRLMCMQSYWLYCFWFILYIR